MSYLVLARKYRPQTFSEVVGQTGAVRILQNAVARDRVPHAMLFSGVRGVGKTTLARIMAKAVNCEGETGSPPCNQCDSCVDITRGSAVDLKEIDGASNRGIQEIRGLQEDLRFMPSRCRYKVVIIDEVHMLTDQAFNALLKTIEEPPAHVIFMFATTEVHKIPVTILSRCQRFELKRVAFAELMAAFAAIAASEGVEIGRSGLEMITREAGGSVRDGLSLLDQVFSLGGDKVGDDDIREVLGLVNQAAFADLSRAVLSADLSAALKVVDQCISGGVDIRRFHAGLLEFFRSLLVCRAVDDPAALLAVSDRDLAVLKEISSAYSLEDIAAGFDFLLKGGEELKFTPQPRMVLEMLLLRMTRAAGVVGIDEILRRLDAMAPGEDGDDGPAYPTGAVAGVSQAAMVAEAKKKISPSPPDAEPERIAPVSEAVSPPEPDKVPAAVDPGKDVRRDWNEFISYVAERRIRLSTSLKLATPVVDGDGLELRFDERGDCKFLEEKENLHILTEFTQDFFQQDLRVIVRVIGESKETVADDQTQHERQNLRNDPLVAMTLEVLDGRIADVRTGPRSRA